MLVCAGVRLVDLEPGTFSQRWKIEIPSPFTPNVYRDKWSSFLGNKKGLGWSATSIASGTLERSLLTNEKLKNSPIGPVNLALRAR